MFDSTSQRMLRLYAEHTVILHRISEWTISTIIAGTGAGRHEVHPAKSANSTSIQLKKTSMCDRLSSKTISLLPEKAITITCPYTRRFAIIIPSVTHNLSSSILSISCTGKYAKANLFLISLQHHLGAFPKDCILNDRYSTEDTVASYWHPDSACHIILSSPCCREPNQSSSWITHITIKTGPTVS